MSLGVLLYITQGLKITIAIFIVTLIASIPLGVFFAIGKIACGKILRGILDIYTWLFRGTPLMLQLLFVNFGLPMIFGFSWPERIYAAYIAFILNYAAYFTEIFRAAIGSIDKGQYEASKALGMSYPMTMRRIVIPQAFKRCIPPVGNEVITLIKDTALVMAISVGDMMRNTKEMVSSKGDVRIFFIAAAIYLILTYGIVFIFKKLEKKMDYYE